MLIWKKTQVSVLGGGIFDHIEIDVLRENPNGNTFFASHQSGVRSCDQPPNVTTGGNDKEDDRKW